MFIGIIGFLISGQGPEEFPEFLFIPIVVVVIVYLIRKWSREWNNRNDVKAWSEDFKL